MNLNWVDWVIIAVTLLYILRGWETGIIRLGTSLISFLASLWLSIKYHTVVGGFLAEKFGFPSLWATVVGYITIGLAAETFLGQILAWGISLLPPSLSRLKMNNFLGALLSMINGAILVAFALVVIMAFPFKGTIKNDISASFLGIRIIKLAEKYGGEFKSSLKEVTQATTKFLTVEPKSNEKLSLNLDRETLQLKVDEKAENTMLTLVNNEREKVGLKALKMDTKIRTVAREKSKDMYNRSYFSHVDPDGHDAGWRMDKAGIVYTIAGENLAFAPDVQTAHTGLMNSEGHRKNILEPRFTRIGIGIINGGENNEMMFTQNFSD